MGGGFYVTCLPSNRVIAKKLFTKSIYLITIGSMLLSSLSIPTSAVSAATITPAQSQSSSTGMPVKKVAPSTGLQDAKGSQLFGSGWYDEQGYALPTPGTKASAPTEKPVVSSQVPSPKQEAIHLKLGAEPAIYMPGLPIRLSWEIKRYETLGTQNASHLVITLPAGVTPQDQTLAAALSTDNKLNITVNKASGTLPLMVANSAVTPLTINVDLMVNGEKEAVSSESVVINAGQFEAKNGAVNKKKPDRSEHQPAIPPEKSRVTVTVPTGAVDQNLVFSVQDPSPNKQPSVSLSGHPIEILAVGETDGKNVTHFNQPITIRVKYDPAQNPSNWAEKDLQLFYYNEDDEDWYPMDTTVDTVNKTLSAQSDHLTVFDYKAASWQGYVPPTVDDFKVSDFSGAGTYSLNFWVPPAPGGLQPSLNLNYNSQVFDESGALTQSSWVGSGWSLDTGSIDRNMHETNDDTSDDTFNISAGGISGRLLPISTTSITEATTIDSTTTGTMTAYNTAEQSYSKVEYDSITDAWIVYDKSGTRYIFAQPVKTNKSDGCGTLNLTWRWMLTTVSDIYGNSLDYTYNIEEKSSCASGKKVQIAVYPQYITYLNSKYRIYFVTTSRLDYQKAWATTSSKTLYGTKRISEIDIQKVTSYTEVDTSSGTTIGFKMVPNYSTIRKYGFSFYNTKTDSDTDPIYPNFTYNKGDFTLTLASVQEMSSDGSAALPATTFYYTDKMHLTRVNNGQGGQVDISYDSITYLDDINEDIRSIHTKFGTDECSGLYGTSWSSYKGNVFCYNYKRLEVGSDSSSGTAKRSIPDSLIKPGNKYRLYIKAQSVRGYAHVNYSIYDESSGSNKSTGFGVYTTAKEATLDVDMPETYNANTTKLHISCDHCWVQVVKLIRYVTYYRATTRTVTDAVAGTSGAYTYQYDNGLPNTAKTSEIVNSVGDDYDTSLYDYPLLEFRGHAMTDIVDPQGLATVNFYYQSDHLKGKAYRSLTLKQNTYDSLDSLDSTQWSSSGTSGTSDTLTSAAPVSYEDNAQELTSSTSSNWVSLQRSASSLSDGQTAFAQFQVSGTSPQAEVGLTSSSGNFFGIVAQAENSQHVVRIRTGSSDGDILIPAGTFSQDAWYGLMLTVDSINGNRIRVWKMGDPTNTVYESVVSGQGSDTWSLRGRVNNGTLWLDTYLEGTLYNESQTSYASVTTTPYGSLAVAKLQKYKDLKYHLKN
jgi:hypothetical protein